MLADVALSDDVGDRLGFKPFADAIAGIIDSPRTATPLVMAINAKWGAGKTTLGQMIKRRLESKSAADGHAPHITCWFASWMHDDASVLSTALASDIAQVASRSRPLWRRMMNPLPSNLSTAGQRKFRKGLKYFFVLIAGVAVCTFASLRIGHSLTEVAKLDPAVMKSLITVTGGAYFTAFALAAYLVFQFMAATLPVAKSLSEFAKNPQAAAQTASMQEVRSQLGKLIKQATPRGSKFVIFVDDLDRCRPPRSVDVLEAINQLLDHIGVVSVLMSDMQVVAKCAEIKYKDLATPDSSATTIRPSPMFSSYGWDFLQKIIQLQFDLPIYPVRMIRQMIEALAREVPEERRDVWWLALWRNLQAKIRRMFSGLFRRRFWGDLSVAVVGMTLVFVPVVLTFTIKAFPPKMKWPIKLGFLVIGWVFGILADGLILRLYRWIRESRRRRLIDIQIRARIAAGERDFSQVEESIRRQNSAWRNDQETEGLVRERLQRYLEDESEIQREAEDEVMRHLEPMPRHAKRLLNRLRLLLFIAHERKMFGGKPELSSRHIGKWAVLGERWPELSQIVCISPQIMKQLENSDTHDSVVRERAPLYENDKALRNFCLSRAGIKLWPVIVRIIQFTPSATQKTLSRPRKRR
jgi:hypothetical protein